LPDAGKRPRAAIREKATFVRFFSVRRTGKRDQGAAALCILDAVWPAWLFSPRSHDHQPRL